MQPRERAERPAKSSGSSVETPPVPSASPTLLAAVKESQGGPRPKRRFEISIYLAWCKRCGICGAFCPTKALVNDALGQPSVANESKCIGCLQCMHRCPDFCVEVSEKKPESGGKS
ncbi:MAG: 4Fe-4S dicluster domain-containing protein [Planctomycetota bacterium]